MEFERKKVLRNLLKNITDLARRNGNRVATMTFEITDIDYFIEAIDKDREETFNYCEHQKALGKTCHDPNCKTCLGDKALTFDVT